MTDAAHVHERSVPPALRWAPWALLLGFFVVAGAFGSWLHETGQGGLGPFSDRVGRSLGIPGWTVGTTILGAALLVVVALLVLYPIWLRYRYGHCTITQDQLTFVQPDLYARPDNHLQPLVVVVERANATWTVTPHGVLVGSPSRSAWANLTMPLLIPTPPEEAEALLRWLETGQVL